MTNPTPKSKSQYKRLVAQGAITEMRKKKPSSISEVTSIVDDMIAPGQMSATDALEFVDELISYLNSVRDGLRDDLRMGLRDE